MPTIDVIKAAYRQTKDGFAITFILHPQDDHEELARAAIGSQWQIKAVPLDENGNAVSGAGNKPPASDWEAGPQPQQRIAAPASSRLTRQAGIACNDRVFRTFLRENEMLRSADSPEEAATAVRLTGGCKSRKEIIPGTPTGDKWEDLYLQFLAWRDMP